MVNDGEEGDSAHDMGKYPMSMAPRNWANGARRPTQPVGGWWKRTLGWLSKCRAILVRYDKKTIQLPGSAPTGMCPYLVPPSMEPS